MRNFILFLLCTFFIFGTLDASDTAELYKKNSNQFLKSQEVQVKFTESQLDQDLLEAAIFHQVNVERVKIRLAPLKYHAKQADLARSNSRMIAKQEQLRDRH
jgi:uncharacterized protein YkwD